MGLASSFAVAALASWIYRSLANALITAAAPTGGGTRIGAGAGRLPVLRHEGLGFSEPMLCGLGSGLSFIYWDGRTMDFPSLEAGSSRSSSPGA